MNPTVLIFALIFALPSQVYAGLTENKKIVTDFYDLAFNQHKPVEAANLYLSEEYVQHNPHVASGRKAFIEAFKGMAQDESEKNSKTIFKRTIAESDLVVLHSHKVNGKPGDRGVAGVDFFRVKNGKITEHWDVNQPIPEKSANQNSMF